MLRYPRRVTDNASGDGDPTPSEQDGRDDAQGRRSARRRSKALLELSDRRRVEIVAALRRARVALPGDPLFGDPLSTAGPGTTRAVARVADRLAGDEPSPARELGLGALQVWQAMLERAGRGKGAREVTVMFTDLVAFSRWSLTAGDEATLDLLRRVAVAVEPPVLEHGGDVVKRMGDGMMAVFASADRAMQAAVAANDNLADIEVDGYRPVMRIGIHTGTPRAVSGDWFGVDVTVAARVMATGGNGRTMISAAALAALHPDTLDKLGRRVKPYRRNFFAPLSGVPEDLRIYTVLRSV